MKRQEMEKGESGSKKFFKFIGGLALDVAMHAITATKELQARRSVSVERLGEYRLVIKINGKTESLPVVFANKNQYNLVREALMTGKKIDLALECLVSLPNTDPTILKAEILTVHFAS